MHPGWGIPQESELEEALAARAPPAAPAPEAPEPAPKVSDA